MKNDLIEIFTRKLNELMKERNITQYKLINDLDLKKTTVNSWCNGKAFPRQDKLKMLADYFNIPVSDLIEDSKENTESNNYYLDPETRKTAEELRTNKDLKILFDAARDASPEDLKTVHAMLLALKRKEQHIDEY